ncbi:MAG: zf-HC2 domain-containing protein [Thermodesulfobacteriota bacterium]
MKWQCALLQRWLPEYPDGDIPGWGKRWLRHHLDHCAACRRELAGFQEMITAVKASPAQEPGPEFWNDFSREMHLKLVKVAQEGQAAPESPFSRWLRLPYLLGAPVLAVLLLWVAVHLTGPGNLAQNQGIVKQEAKPEMPVKVAGVPQRTPAPPPAPVAAAPAEGLEQFVTVALEENGTLPLEEAEISGWDLDSELAGMSDQEKEIFFKRVYQRAKDGSCLEKYVLCSWG